MGVELMKIVEVGGELVVRYGIICKSIFSALILLTTQAVTAASLNISDGDVIFGTLASPVVQEQESVLCFNPTTGQLGTCPDSVQGLPEELRVAVCELYVQSTLLIPSFCDSYIVKNDGYEPGQNAGFQAGFIAGEESASTLGPFAGPVLLRKVRFLVGPDGTETITLKIYEESGAAIPGAEIFSQDYAILGSTDFLMQVDLTAEGILIAGGDSIRVSLKYNHAGTPAIARDDDGSILPDRNWIYADGIGWVDSMFFGLTGDWIIRAIVEPQ